MGRPARVYWDESARAWATNAFGPMCYTKTGRAYRKKQRNYEIPKHDQAGAWAWLAEGIEADRKKLAPISNITFEDVCEHYLKEAEQALPKETYSRRVEHLNRFGNWPSKGHPQRMDRRSALSITPADVKKFMEAVAEDGCSASYIRDGLLKTVKRVYSWAHDLEEGKHAGLPLASNPIAKVKGPEVQRRAFRPAEREAVEKFMAWMETRALGMDGLKQRFARIAVALLECLRATGARPKEFCSAQWKDLEVRPDGWSTIKLEYWKNATKTGEIRTIALPPRCTERIEWIRKQSGHHRTHIFTHRRGRGAAESGVGSPLAGDPWVVDPRTGDTKSLQKWFYRVVDEARKAGVPLPEGFRLYWLRSGYSTEAQRQGVPSALIAKSMGTSERMLARSYTDLDTEDIVGTAKRVEEGRSGGT